MPRAFADLTAEPASSLENAREALNKSAKAVCSELLFSLLGAIRRFRTVQQKTYFSRRSNASRTRLVGTARFIRMA